jgi:Ferric uptake regulator family
LFDELDLLHLHFYKSHGPRDHIHVACIRCGKVREFESQLYEELKQQVSHDCGIEITVARTEVGGLCAHRRAKSCHCLICFTRRAHFVAVIRWPRTEVGGLCNDCRAKS